MGVKKLEPAQLYHRCDPEQFSFQTTEELDDLTEAMGQPRAVESLSFGIGIESEGYNVFALGEPGTGKQHLVNQFLKKRATEKEIPPDFCYVNNFKEPHKPKVLQLPTGRGKELAEDMDKLVEEAGNALKAAFDNEEYQNRRLTIMNEFREKQHKAFEELQEKAKERGLAVIRSPSGLVFAPLRDDDEVIPPDEFQKLPEEERKEVQSKAEQLQEEGRKIFQVIPEGERETRRKLEDLNREVIQYAVGSFIEELRKKYHDLENVLDYLKAVEKDITENTAGLLPQQGEQQQQEQQMPLQGASVPGQGPGPGQVPGPTGENPAHQKYKVNLIIDHSETQEAPVIYEDNPTYHNLIGRIEHLPYMGTLITDFNMIRPGALHRANGGYLVLDALKVLQQPLAWEGLKRAIRSKQIKMDSLGQMYGMVSTVSLEPEPVSLDAKVTLLGSPMFYYLLRHYDPEFGELFKVAADFDWQMNRSEENEQLYGRLIGTVARKEKLRHFDRGAVARVIEHSGRMAGDGEKLFLHMQRITDLLREASYWAGQNGNETVTSEDVQHAIDAWTFRSDRLRERIQEQIERGTILIDTEEAKIGQANGLSVLLMGEFAFGRPSRITARVRLGKGEVIDIEREVEMGGPIHSKGVLILSGFLGGRYATEQPLSLSASLVFEQSYGGVDGDSASSAELYTLLSAIAEVPIRQNMAVTGSVNQHGQVQPIGGVNEKIEGFFDTCRNKGLTGDQGVLIPATNVKNLMLRQDIIETVKEGKFHIYPVETIDQGIEILTGIEAGEPDEKGAYPPDTVNGKVQARLAALAKKQLEFAQAMKKEGPEE